MRAPLRERLRAWRPNVEVRPPLVLRAPRSPAAAGAAAPPREEGPTAREPGPLPGADGGGLCQRLKSSGATAVTLTFDDLERLGTALPPAARESAQWWANDPSLPHARQGWLEAGWRASLIDLAGRTATFSRRR